MSAWPRLSLAAVAALIGLAGSGVTGAAPTPTQSPWGVQQPVSASQSFNSCQRPPSQPQLWYDTNICCKPPESWKQACLDWIATQATGTSPATSACVDPVWVCTAPPPAKH